MSNDQQIIKLMARLRELGCRISADGDKLRLRKTKNDIPAELIQQIKINKTDNKNKNKAVRSPVISIPKKTRIKNKKYLASNMLFFLLLYKKK